METGKARIDEDLRGKSVKELVYQFIDLLWRDVRRLRKLNFPAAFLQGDDEALEEHLCDALEHDDLRDHEVPRWAVGANIVLDTIAELIAIGRASLALSLVHEAMGWIYLGEETIDRAGHVAALLIRVRDIHLAATRVVRPAPIALARELYALESSDEAFHRAAGIYADVLGDDGLAEYRRLAAADWEMLPPSRETGSLSGSLGDHARPMRVLDFFAEQEGNVDARIALRTKDLSAPRNYWALAQFCSAQGREQEAIRWAQEGLRIFGHSWSFKSDRRLLFLTIDLLTNAGRIADATAQLWRALETYPALDIYSRLCELGGEAARSEALKLLEARAVADMPLSNHLLVSVLTHDQAFDAAWAALGKFGAPPGTKQTLARASEATHPREALAVYAERVDELVGYGRDSTYAEAAELVAHMAGLRRPAAHAEYVIALKARFARKRNFMQLLD